MDHSQFGHWQFLRIGPGCTYYRDVPKRLPDMGGQINWPYMLDKVFDSEEALLEFFTVEKVS